MKYDVTLPLLLSLCMTGCSNPKSVNASDTAVFDTSTAAVHPVIVSPAITPPDTGFTPVAENDSIAQQTDEQKQKIAMDLNTYLIKSLPNADFTAVNKKAVIIVFPDSIQAAKMKKEYGEENVSVMADDAGWYHAEAREFAQAKNTNTIDLTTRYIKFKTKTGHIFFDTRAEGANGWLIILFKPDTLPKVIYSIDIKGEYEKYFENK